jgi:hypothetical protein
MCSVRREGSLRRKWAHSAQGVERRAGLLMERRAISSVAAVAGGGNVGVMKFNATIVLEFTAHDVAEAGERVNALLEHAGEAALETRSIELSTAPGVAVSLPPVGSAR